MKKLLVLVVFAALLMPALAIASEFKAGDEYYIHQGQTVNGDLYYGGEAIYVLGDANGDVVVGAGKATIQGRIGQDLVIGAGQVDIMGNVTDDVRIGAGQIKISGNIGGDLLVMGGEVDILPQAIISGDVFVAGGRINIGGRIGGTLRAIGGEINIDNQIGGSAFVNSGKLSVGNSAAINGDLKYSSPREANISQGAEIRGNTEFTRRREEGRSLFGFWFFAKVLIYFVCGLFFVLIFRKPTRMLIEEALMDVPRSIGRGFLALVAAPILAILLMVSILGMPLGFVLILLYAAVLILVSIFGVVLTGKTIEKWLAKKEMELSWKTVAFGAIAYTILGFIPILGWLAKFLIFLMVLGAIVHLLRREWWVRRAEAA